MGEGIPNTKWLCFVCCVHVRTCSCRYLTSKERKILFHTCIAVFKLVATMSIKFVFPSADWASPLKDALGLAPRPIRVISPCVGLNAPERASRELGMPWKSTGDYEINGSLYPALQAFSEAPEHLHVGPCSGNVCSIRLEDLDKSTDAIVSGPPCPPFSSMGKRLCELDIRACVFNAVCAWVIFLATFGQLKFFVLENVEGIVRKRKHAEESFADWFISAMMLELPKGWRIQIHHGNSIDCALPQSRPRVFFVGTCACMRATAFQRRVLDRPLMKFPRPDIILFLDHSSSDSDFESLSVRQQVNVLEQMDNLMVQIAARSSDAAPVTVAIADIARDPTCGKVDGGLCFGRTNTLRTNNHYLWILPSPEWQSVFGARGRFLSIAEKCRIAGIVPESVSRMHPADVEIALGNTIPVSLIGVVLFPILRAWIHAVRASEEDEQ